MLGDARAKISSLKTTVAEQKRQLEARSHDGHRLEQLQNHLTGAFQGMSMLRALTTYHLHASNDLPRPAQPHNVYGMDAHKQARIHTHI